MENIENTFYAGIGSRDTPRFILEYMVVIGAFLAKKGFTLRSGGATGADSAFEIGCDKLKGRKEIYLPWRGFEGSKSDLIVVQDGPAYDIARKYHPRFDKLKYHAKLLMARNSHQVLGEDLNTNSRFIICYTEGGKGIGGTGQAIRIAKEYNIPIFDMGNYSDLNVIKVEIRKFLINNEILSEEDFPKIK